MRQMFLNVLVVVTLFIIPFITANTSCDNKMKIQIPVISTMDMEDIQNMDDYGVAGVDIATTGGAITVGHMLAQQDINSDDHILPCYEIEAITIPCSGNTSEALKQTIFKSFQGICNGNSSIIASPIFLGAPWSKLSKIESMVLDMFNLLTISSTSTEPSLTEKHKSFLRTIGNDNHQARALVHLCNHFKWTEIGIIYINSEYGQGLNNAIINQITQDEAININVKSKPYDVDSIDSAAKFIKDHALYVNILIVRDEHILQFFEQLESHNVWGKPYFYIGVDSWFVEAEIEQNEILKYVGGYIGTTPGFLSMLTAEQYNKSGIHNGNMSIYDATVQKNDAIADTVENKFNKDHHSMINFGYDSMYTVGKVLHIYAQRHSLDTMFNDFNCSFSNLDEFQMQIQDLEQMQAELRDILANEIDFIGATGHASFDDKGDREGSMFLYGYATHYGEIKYFGGMVDGHASPFIDDNVVEWPYDFDGKRPISNKALCLKKINSTFVNFSTTVNTSHNATAENISNISTTVNTSNNAIAENIPNNSTSHDIVITLPYFVLLLAGVFVVSLSLGGCLGSYIMHQYRKPQAKIQDPLEIKALESKSNLHDELEGEEKADRVYSIHDTQNQNKYKAIAPFDESKSNDDLNSLPSRFQNYMHNLNETEKQTVQEFIEKFKINKLVSSSGSQTVTPMDWTHTHVNSSGQMIERQHCSL